MLTLLIVIIVIALLFDLVNGFHDAANSIATVVSTKVLTPLQAVIWAAAFNVLAFWVFDMSVGNTVAKTVDNSAIDLWVILAGLIAATFWNLFTWYLGLPSSSSPIQPKYWLECEACVLTVQPASAPCWSSET